jgi:ribosomal protein S15P/S13E
MGWYKSLLWALLLFSVMSLSAQTNSDDEEVDPILITLKGRILNLDDESPVPYVSIVNFRTHGGTTTNEAGYFTMEMLNVDSLSISALGYSKMVAKVPAKHNPNDLLIIYAKPIRFSIQEVKVTGDKKGANVEGIPQGKKVDIDPQLRGDSYNKKPPVVAAVINPLSFMQYHLSKSERDKRETRQAIITEKQWETLSKYYNKDLVKELTGLNDDEAELFMIYFNSKGLLAQLKTEYDVRAAIVEQFKLYQKEKSEK